VTSDGEDSGEGGGPAEISGEPRSCMACRGSGKVISNLGGTSSTLACPWCEGSGMRVPGIDAQARWIEQGSEGVAASTAGQPAA
jgi:DnaJ-class molecular chaperone